MTSRQAIILCVVLTVLFSLPSLAKVEAVFPLYVSSEVRKAAPQALEKLRSQGLWLVNVKLVGIGEHEDEICFEWEHRYSGRTGKDTAEWITTCVHAT